MSGGSYDYAYAKINYLADQIENNHDPRLTRPTGCEPVSEPQVYSKERKEWLTGAEAQAIIDAADAERKWFVRLLRLVSAAAHDIEWVDSSDYGPGDEVEAIRAIRKILVREERDSIVAASHRASADLAERAALALTSPSP